MTSLAEHRLAQPMSKKASPWIAAALLCALLSPVCRATEGTAPIDSRAQDLMREIEARKSLPIDHRRWRAENGPWASYLMRSFEEGLSPRERALYDAAVEEGNCVLAQSLRAAGFLLLYPYLARVHTKPYVQRYFQKTVIYGTSAASYCSAKAELNRVLELAHRERLNVLPFRALSVSEPAGRTLFDNKSADTLENRIRNSVCSGMWGLTRLALENRYRPAVQDLVAFVGERGMLVLNGEQEYLLFRIAARLGLNSPWVQRMSQSSDLRTDLNTTLEIDRFVREHQAGPAPVDVLWFCRWPRLQPFLPLPAGRGNTEPRQNK